MGEQRRGNEQEDRLSKERIVGRNACLSVSLQMLLHLFPQLGPQDPPVSDLAGLLDTRALPQAHCFIFRMAQKSFPYLHSFLTDKSHPLSLLLSGALEALQRPSSLHAPALCPVLSQSKLPLSRPSCIPRAFIYFLFLFSLSFYRGRN